MGAIMRRCHTQRRKEAVGKSVVRTRQVMRL